jgi:hypothetical protein
MIYIIYTYAYHILCIGMVYYILYYHGYVWEYGMVLFTDKDISYENT